MTITVEDRTRTTHPAVGAGLMTVGAVLAVNAAALGTQIMFGGGGAPYSATAATTVHLVHYVLWWAALVALSALAPRLPGVPPGVGTLVGIGATLEACSRFVQAFVSPYLAAHAPQLLDTAPDAVLLVPLLGTGVVLMVGMVALAVVAARRRMIRWPAAVLLIFGALAIPALGPVSNVLLGAGLIWLGRAARRPGRD